jgi:hypothetical protein
VNNCGSCQPSDCIEAIRPTSAVDGVSDAINSGRMVTVEAKPDAPPKVVPSSRLTVKL